MGLKDIAKSGILGVGPALVADNPKLLNAFGVVGNIAADKIEDREEKKRREAAQMAETGAAPGTPTPMKKGGKVRGCGIAQRGLTKGKMR